MTGTRIVTEIGLLLICHVMVLGPLEAQNCLPDGLVLSSQQQLDAFPDAFAGCRHVLGDLRIAEAANERISDLSGLRSVCQIDGSLVIDGNRDLGDLSGLDSLTVIRGSLVISNNSGLSQLQGLNRLQVLEQSLRLNNNQALTRVTGLQNLEAIGQSLNISHNASLEHVSGLSRLSHIGEQLNVLSNPKLNKLSGFGEMEMVGGILQLLDNPAMRDLTGLHRLRVVGEDLIIDSNAGLVSLDGLDSLRQVGAFLQVVNNTSLASLKGLQNLREVVGLLQIYNNPALFSLSGLDSLDTALLEDLALLSSMNLSHCSIRSICRYLNLERNQSSIGGNASGCDNKIQILAGCQGAAVDSQPDRARDILLYPNPGTDVVNIKGREIDGARVLLFDGLGRLVRRTLVNDRSFTLEGLPSGYYQLRFQLEETSFNKTIIKIE